MNMRHLRRVVPLLIAAGATFGILLATNSLASPAASSHHATAYRGHHHVSSRLTMHFKLFRVNAAHAADAIGTPARPADLGDVPGFGTDPSQAHYVQVQSGFGVWVVPGSAGVCMFVPVSLPRGTIYRGRCNTVAAADSGGFRGIVGQPGSRIAFGLVPDGNSSVTVTHTDGSTTTTPVDGNVYATSADNLESITVHDASGHTVSLPTVLPSPMQG